MDIRLYLSHLSLCFSLSMCMCFSQKYSCTDTLPDTHRTCHAFFKDTILKQKCPFPAPPHAHMHTCVPRPLMSSGQYGHSGCTHKFPGFQGYISDGPPHLLLSTNSGMVCWASLVTLQNRLYSLSSVCNLCYCSLFLQELYDYYFCFSSSAIQISTE